MSGLVEVEPDEWDELLDRVGCPDAYLRRGYVDSASILDRGRPVLLHLAGADGDVVFPLLLRELPAGGGHDVATPYGYGGPVATGANPPKRQFWDLYHDWCADRGVVTSFVRFHPLLANHRDPPPGMRLEFSAGTVGWRLDRPDLFAAMHRAHRRACRKATRAGVSVSVHESPGGLAGFAALYEQTMRRVGAGDFYLFPPRYWDALASGLTRRLALFEAREGGEVAAAALCLATPPWLHYHLGASADRGRALGASHLLFYEAARWAHERGYGRFHLGGGVGGRDDSLLTFKHRFDPDGGLLEFAVGKVVHDADAYRKLAGGRADDAGGFFPAYRATP